MAIKKDGVFKVWSGFCGVGAAALYEMRHLLYCQVDNSIFPTSHIKFSILEASRALHTIPELPF